MKATYFRTATADVRTATTTSSSFNVAAKAGRFLGLLAILAAMLTAPASARPIQLVLSLLDPFHGCSPNLGLCVTSFNYAAGLAPARATAEIRKDADTEMLYLSFSSQTPAGTEFPIADDIVLDRARSLALGYQQVTLKRGTYSVDRSLNPNGTVAVEVETQGIWVEVKYGRQSASCTGFGICRIVIGTDAAAMNGSAMLNGNTLSVDFLNATDSTQRSITIDEDIALDKMTSVGLGAQGVTLLKGTYEIDRSSNPNGTVNIPVSRFGIIIHIETGRKSRDCHGFGICSIVIDVDLRMAAAGSLNGNTLSLDFLSPLTSDDGSNTLVIDEDIVLSPATARALGAGHVTVLKGSYVVDRSSNPNGHVELPVHRVGIVIDIEVGRRSKGCTGFGICSITIDVDLRSANPSPAVVTLEDGAVTINFTERPTAASDRFVLDEAVVVGAKLARALGVQSVVLPAGSYSVDYSSNPNGTIVIPVNPEGTSLTIYIGRSWGNCRGFGICNITLDNLFTDRAVKGTASVKGSTLSLDFLGEAPDRGEMLVIDEDIVLDPATARALGYRSITVKHGSYPVDYSSNPNGHVNVTIATVGITIVIEVGRQSRDCRRLGICDITIELRSMMNRPVVTAAVAGNDVMALDFTEVLPEQGDTLYVDQDIELSADEARAFGKDRMTLKSGAYYIDRSDNQYGSVTVATNDDGTASAEYVADADAPSLSLSVHPNPASSSATVGFNVNGPQTVTLTLLDARGQVVKVLIDGERLAGGRHEQTINLTDLPAGAYFQRLSIGTTNAITPLQVVR